MVVVQRPGVLGYPDHRAVLAKDLGLEVGDGVARSHRPHEVVAAGGVDVEHAAYVLQLADQLLGRIEAVDARQRWVHRQVTPLGRGLEDALHRVLEDGPEPGLSGAKLFQGLPVGSDVVVQHEAAAVPGNRLDLDPDVNRRAVGPTPTGFEADHPRRRGELVRARGGAGLQGLLHFDAARDDDVGQGAPQGLVLAEQPGEGGVRQDDAAVSVQEDHGVRAVGEKLLETGVE